MRNLPAFSILSSQVKHSLISDGCLVEQDSVLDRVVLGVRSLVGPRTVIRNSIILGANYMENPQEREENNRAGIPPIGIGSDCIIENAILDKNCRISNGTKITNKAGHQNYDGPFYYIRDGLVVIPANGIALPGTDI
jgi:glucose-1-phosphate adenylyltransferase